MHAAIDDDLPFDHPSNMLYRGEVTELLTATWVYERAIQAELGHTDSGSPEESWLKRELAAARRVREIWLETSESPDAYTAERLRAEGFDIWADCLLAGDFRNLAI